MKIKYHIIFILLTLLTFTGHSQTVVVSDTVSGRWSAGASPYIITRDVVVPEDTSLIIEAGTEIHFAGNYAIRVEGKFKATGTRKDRIRFTYADSSELADYKEQRDTTAAPVDGWKGIRFMQNQQANDTSVLVFCSIKGVKAITGSGADCAGGGVSIKGNRMVIIKNCVISGNQAHTGAAIYCNGSGLLLQGNTIENNASLSNGGALFLSNCRPVVKNNLIRYNNSPEFGGGIYFEKTGGIFVNNIIAGNEALFGGGISLVKSNIRLVNNTLANNHAINNGGAIHCQQSGPYIKNSIIWGNEAGDKGKQLYLYTLANPEIVYSDIQGGQAAIEKFTDEGNELLNYKNNIDENPLFEENDTALYSLKKASLCIDAGINSDPLVSEGFDRNGNPRIVNKIIDMGACEFRLAEDIKPEESSTDKSMEDEHTVLNIYPNPNNGKFMIEISGQESNVAFLSVVNAGGQTLYTQSLSMEGNNYRQPVEIDFSRGFYFIELRNISGKVIKREKMILE
jgi:predicted outer membrane repeat protein